MEFLKQFTEPEGWWALIGLVLVLTEFALPGLSNTLNIVGIYEKGGFSARLAYNWRDEFLNQVNRPVGSTRNPEYVDSVEQLDLNVSYEFDFGLALSLDAINLNSEGQRKRYGAYMDQQPCSSCAD